MEPKTISIDNVEYIRKDDASNLPAMTTLQAPYKIGQAYHIRTVTMALSGRIKWVGEKELVLTECCWIADSGRFADYLKDTSKASEVEPMNGDVIVGRGAIIDATEVSSLPSSHK